MQRSSDSEKSSNSVTYDELGHWHDEGEENDIHEVDGGEVCPLPRNMEKPYLLGNVAIMQSLDFSHKGDSCPSS